MISKDAFELFPTMQIRDWPAQNVKNWVFGGRDSMA
jgi:hypothetical protein